MSLLLYRVLAASGGYVNGLEVAIGAEIPLTAEEARYEVDAGNVLPTGKVPPLPPALAPVRAGDLVQMRRGPDSRAIELAAFEAYLIRAGGAVEGYVDVRADEIAVALSRVIDDRIAGIADLAKTQVQNAIEGVLRGTTLIPSLKDLIDRINSPSGGYDAWAKARPFLPTDGTVPAAGGWFRRGGEQIFDLVFLPPQS